MPRKWTVALMMLILSFVSCRNGERATVTGGYGAAVVMGEVVMASAGSPQGVEVSVRGTGQRLILGADGRFAFSGVPNDVQLDFRRASDGIDASLRLEAAGHVVIELAKSEARTSSKRGGVRGGASDLTVEVGGGSPVTVQTDASTRIEKKKAPITLAQIAAGDRVKVEGTRVSANVVLAKEIEVK